MSSRLEDIALQYKRVLETVDAWFARCKGKAGELIRCDKGCCSCCRGLFDITLIDAYLLQIGFSQLPEVDRRQVLVKAEDRLRQLKQQWPGFAHPYVLNSMPDHVWTEMPEEDQTPCPLLGEDGSCLVYAWRPLVCRQHGLPNIDLSGTRFSELYCSLNFAGVDPFTMPQIRGEFQKLFEQEMALFGAFTSALFGAPINEADTFIPTALFIDFSRISSPPKG
jgi:Fe-S-cluster containining protein